ncbi:MAG: amidohydrolase family protein [Desulfovibrio sp.]|jgi:predicted TIM-barrel fold metal-dependent hydrolase|nr:amidohydrolase family protein [Desulfovibrio sp.]
MFIDIHTHAFHAKIARKAIAQINAAYATDCTGDGTIEHLLAREKAAGINRFVVLCAATTPAQVIPANNYAISLQKKYPQVIAFGSMHPGYKNFEDELTRLQKAGIRGLKMHPDFQGFGMDDENLFPILEYAQKKFIIQFHVGSNKNPGDAPSSPGKLAAILDNFPDLVIIAGHLGGYLMWEEAIRLFGGRRRENLWFDTSSVSFFAHGDTVRELLRTWPEERLLFGSDWPLFDIKEEQERLRRVGRLTRRKLEKIMSNANALFAASA